VQEVSISAAGSVVTASVHGGGPTTIVLGHGAGGNRKAPFLVRLAETLAAAGRGVVLYNFPYTEARRRIPDRPEVLEATTRTVGEFVWASLGATRLVHGGKSMGGRIASQAVAQGAPADALIFLGYPLHPPGKPEKLRDRHLPEIGVPMLFVQGTRDAFARNDLLAPLLERLGEKATLHAIEDGDHSFAVRKRAGRTAKEVEADIAQAIGSWLDARAL